MLECATSLLAFMGYTVSAGEQGFGPADWLFRSPERPKPRQWRSLYHGREYVKKLLRAQSSTDQPLVWGCRTATIPVICNRRSELRWRHPRRPDFWFTPGFREVTSVGATDARNSLLESQPTALGCLLPGIVCHCPAGHHSGRSRGERTPSPFLIATCV